MLMKGWCGTVQKGLSTWKGRKNYVVVQCPGKNFKMTVTEADIAYNGGNNLFG